MRRTAQVQISKQLPKPPSRPYNRPMTDLPLIFDSLALARARDRAAPRFAQHDFLWREIAERLGERLGYVLRDFDLAAELGARGRDLGPILAAGGRGPEQIKRMIRLSPHAWTHPDIIGDSEALALAPGQFDLIVSVMDLHRMNDLPGALWQINRALKPDGLFLGSLFGSETLRELRRALMEAELAVTGGAGPRVAPFLDVRDAGQLMQRAGFALPVVDTETITVDYPDVFALMRDLRGMGETNVLMERRKRFTPRAVFIEAARLYHERCARPDGRVVAQFEIITLTGWRPDMGQQQPLKPGSAKTRLADMLGAQEIKIKKDSS